MLNLLDKLWGAPTATKGIAASALAHGSTAAICLAWGWFSVSSNVERPQLPGEVTAIQLQAQMPASASPESVVELPLEVAVVVMPREARVETQQYVLESTALPASDAELAAVERLLATPPRRAESAPASAAHPASVAPTETQPSIPRAAAAPAAPQQADVHGVTSASWQGNPPPIHPLTAWREGLSGRVVLRVRVAASGYVSAVDIRRSSGHGVLDATAVNAVRRWRFRPATVAGEPVACEVDLPVDFPKPR
jgi:protein TonB